MLLIIWFFKYCLNGPWQPWVVLFTTMCSPLLPTVLATCASHVPANTMSQEHPRPGEIGGRKKALACSWCYSCQPPRSHMGQTLLSFLRQSLNTKLRNAALDSLSPHWSWQYECNHGAKWCFRKWGCTSSLVLLHSRLPTAPVSMGLFQLQDMESEGPFYIA